MLPTHLFSKLMNEDQQSRKYDSYFRGVSLALSDERKLQM
jgi:hypothetical protein